ncbi:hypothetical protein BN14_04232 [Rhizoctonia solani AG-1 IB]|uniref:Uso1/p115-like vesicle tethering protein C-terminal domain-containing protein n=1 Tax=Thanatephorus cucumeris (strain AG1-IB / isolate 7/3/14) TaxID=1108050 RepID=M5BR26_THACB|nr:hypothetical protein BN14_04232 [Rhizoctonia solani AG-1 IB]
MARVREDERFKAIGPDSPVIPAGLGLEDEPQPEEDGEVVGGDVWLDWGFVEFWKGNAYTIQRAITVDPDAAASNASMNEETAELIRSLKETIRAQAGELESLTEQLGKLTKERDELVKGCSNAGGDVEKVKKQLEEERAEHASKLEQMRKEREEERESHASQIAALTEKVADTTTELDKVRAQKTDSEKEQEDLLVFLEELSSKRKKDKARMKEKGMDVSEDEDAEGDE